MFLTKYPNEKDDTILKYCISYTDSGSGWGRRKMSGGRNRNLKKIGNDI